MCTQDWELPSGRREVDASAIEELAADATVTSTAELPCPTTPTVAVRCFPPLRIDVLVDSIILRIRILA
jgi:hypothetical protein